MRRGAFIASGAAFAAAPRLVRAQEQYDPGQASNVPMLRVLLGHGPVNAQQYRGTISTLGDGSVINLVSIEEYLYSVVPAEMSPSWPAAAMQAQAVCARTYVLQRSSPGRAYDLVPSEADQVYRGIASESAAGRAAVDTTNGQVLRFDGRYAQVMYSSCCGGHTESSSDAWGGAPTAYLAGVPCPYCTNSPNYRWSRDVSRSAIAATFSREIEPYGTLQGIYVGAIDGSGRAKTVELRCDRGSAFVKGSDFRTRVGSRVVPSLLITAVGPSAFSPDATNLKGGGLGHGVGLCQWGARGMALDGKSAREILQYYFPGTTTAHE